MAEKIVVNYKYALRPTKQQDSAMWRTLECCRKLYNEALDLWTECYQTTRIGANKNLLDNYFKDTYKNEVHSQVRQNVNARLQRSFENFFEKRARYPKMKKRYRYTSFTYPQSGFVLINDKRLKLSGIGDVKIILHRPIPGKIKTCTIKRTRTGKWFAVFTIELTPSEFYETPTSQNNNAVGLDIGIATFASLSDGTQIANPRFLLKTQTRLKREQRRLSRKKKGSRNYRKQCRKLAQLHETVRNKRLDFHFQTAHWLVNNYGLVAVERMTPMFMLKNRKLAKHAADLAFGQFFRLLEYEAVKHGTLAGQVDPRNTSQLCSKCGQIVLKDLFVRVHRCPYCGFVCDRDINAAINIVDRIPEELKPKYNLLRNDTAGTAGITKPVEKCASACEAINFASKHTSSNQEARDFSRG